jgi:hypothetical protein
MVITEVVEVGCRGQFGREKSESAVNGCYDGVCLRRGVDTYRETIIPESLRNDRINFFSVLKKSTCGGQQELLKPVNTLQPWSLRMTFTDYHSKMMRRVDPCRSQPAGCHRDHVVSFEITFLWL